MSPTHSATVDDPANTSATVHAERETERERERCDGHAPVAKQPCDGWLAGWLAGWWPLHTPGAKLPVSWRRHEAAAAEGCGEATRAITASEAKPGGGVDCTRSHTDARAPGGCRRGSPRFRRSTEERYRTPRVGGSGGTDIVGAPPALPGHSSIANSLTCIVGQVGKASARSAAVREKERERAGAGRWGPRTSRVTSPPQIFTQPPDIAPWMDSSVSLVAHASAATHLLLLLAAEADPQHHATRSAGRAAQRRPADHDAWSWDPPACGRPGRPLSASPRMKASASCGMVAVVVSQLSGISGSSSSPRVRGRALLSSRSSSAAMGGTRYSGTALYAAGGLMVLIVGSYSRTAVSFRGHGG
jgi:hypothetical protein